MVFRVRHGDINLALKVAKSAEHDRRLIAEARRLLLSRCSALPRLLDVGRIPTDRSGLTAGRVFIALEWCEGEQSTRAGSPAAKQRLRTALVVARDVASALDDLHAMGVSHGDVKPDNVLFDAKKEQAALIDLGLAGPLSVVTPSGGTPRYLPPETTLGTGDGRARDLFALGMTLAEIVNPELQRSRVTPSQVAKLPSAIRDVVAALLSVAPAARPSADWVVRQASVRLGANPEETPEQWVTRAYLSTRKRDVWQASRYEVSPIQFEGKPAAWLKQAIELGQRIQRVSGGVRDESGPPLQPLGCSGPASLSGSARGAAGGRLARPGRAHRRELV